MRRSNSQPSLRGAARFPRRASSRRMLPQPSMRVRESSAEEIEERQTDWAYSRPLVILDLIWNLAFIVVSICVLIVSRKEDPSPPDLYAIGALTVFIGGVLVGVLFGESDIGKLRIPAEFRWVDSVNGVWDRIFDRMKVKGNVILEVDEVVRKAVVVGEVVDVVVSGGDDDDVKVWLVAGVEEMADGVKKKFSDGVDALTNGVNGLFRTVLKTRNGRLDM